MHPLMLNILARKFSLSVGVRSVGRDIFGAGVSRYLHALATRRHTITVLAVTSSVITGLLSRRSR